MYSPYEYVYLPFFLIPQNYQTELVQPTSNNIAQELPQMSQNRNNSEQFFELFRQQLENRKPTFSKKVWQDSEDEILLSMYEKGKTWEEISKSIPKTNPQICKRRFIKLKQKVSRWSKKDDKIIKLKREDQNKSWEQISEHFEGRTPKQVRQRYQNYLRQGININQWQIEQDLTILRLMKSIGKKWKNISQQIKNRTQIQVKNRYYGTLQPIEKKVNLLLEPNS